MSFFDPKEEVLDIELTSYGKYLLSKGRFSPQYYAFFDSDVLYDSEYAGFVELQNSSSGRIVDETPQLKPQTIWAGVETNIKKNNEYVRAGGINPCDGRLRRLGSQKIQLTPDRQYSLTAPLGTMKLSSDNAPAWQVGVLDGEIFGTVEYKQSETHPTLKIPQLDMETVLYKMLIREGLSGTFAIEDDGSLSEVGVFSPRFEDGSFVDITEDQIVLEIYENNTDFENFNFDIEVYEVETDENNMEVLVPLNFIKKKPLIVDGILLDPEDVDEETPEINESFVEYFFDVLVDNEIDDELLCSLNPTNLPDEAFNQRQLDCRQIEKREKKDKVLYETNVQESDLEDIC